MLSINCEAAVKFYRKENKTISRWFYYFNIIITTRYACLHSCFLTILQLTGQELPAFRNYFLNIQNELLRFASLIEFNFK